jgi:hypothetical protein
MFDNHGLKMGGYKKSLAEIDTYLDFHPTNKELSEKCYNGTNPCVSMNEGRECDEILNKTIIHNVDQKYRQCYASCTERDGSLRLCKRKWLATTSPFYVCKGHQGIVGFSMDSKGVMYSNIDPMQDTNDIELPARIYVGESVQHGFMVTSHKHLYLMRLRAADQNIILRKLSKYNRDLTYVDKLLDRTDSLLWDTKYDERIPGMDRDSMLDKTIQRLDDIVDSDEDTEQDRVPMFVNHGFPNYKKSMTEIDAYIGQ